MSRKPEIDPMYYENNDFGDELAEAKRTGDLMVAQPGENTIEAIKRHMQAKKKITVSIIISGFAGKLAFSPRLII